MSSSEDDARKRLEGRFEEFLSTEKALLDGIDQLVEHLEVVLSNPKWKFKAEQSGLISRTSQAAKNVGALHREMAEVLLLGGNDAGALPLTFESLGSKFEEEYTVYQLVASHAILVLQKLSGGQVGSPPIIDAAHIPSSVPSIEGYFPAPDRVAFPDFPISYLIALQVRGDSAVGSGGAHSPQGVLAAQASVAQELLSRPTLRIMRYQLYMEEMALDAERGGDAGLCSKMREGLETVRKMGSAINEGVRRMQRRERVRLIAQRVRAVPEGISIEAPGREFIMDNDK